MQAKILKRHKYTALKGYKYKDLCRCMIPGTKQFGNFPSVNTLYKELYIIDMQFSKFNFDLLTNKHLEVGCPDCGGAFLESGCDTDVGRSSPI